MLKWFKLITLIVLFLNNLVVGQSINLMTYNLRYDNPNDGENRWDNRKELILSQIMYYEPDIIGTQEGLKHQLEWLDENLTDFRYEGVGRDIGRASGPGEHRRDGMLHSIEFALIFYLRTLLQSRIFGFSMFI